MRDVCSSDGYTAQYNTSVADLKASIIKSLAFRTSKIDSSVISHTSKWALQCACNLQTGIFEIIPVWLNVYRSGGMICEKIMDATVHPYQYDCPKGFLALAKKYPPNLSGNCVQWFTEWLEHSEAHQPKKSLSIEYGKSYLLANGQVAHIVAQYDKKNWIGIIGVNRFKIKKSLVKDAA